MDSSNLNVVVVIVGSVSTNEHAVNCIVLVRWPAERRNRRITG